VPQQITEARKENTQRRPAKMHATACLCLGAPPNLLLPNESLSQGTEPLKSDFPSPSHVQTEASQQDMQSDCAEPTVKISQRYNLRSTHCPDVVDLREVNKNSEFFLLRKLRFRSNQGCCIIVIVRVIQRQKMISVFFCDRGRVNKLRVFHEHERFFTRFKNSSFSKLQFICANPCRQLGFAWNSLKNSLDAKSSQLCTIKENLTSILPIRWSF
jgi:hypothetical protein